MTQEQVARVAFRWRDVTNRKELKLKRGMNLCRSFLVVYIKGRVSIHTCYHLSYICHSNYCSALLFLYVPMCITWCVKNKNNELRDVQVLLKPICSRPSLKRLSPMIIPGKSFTSHQETFLLLKH
ncbi:hypothetical protein V8G54_003782 [Vigna mungo]|uniref:Uncharacterized protein n=1 Tax=Vigna mungo TaxID=3915 RepID=A0AAQ3PEM0_VIGMU